MKNIDRGDLLNAVLASRDKIDPELETELLEAIVDAETTFSGDGDAAMRAIDTAVTATIDSGVCFPEEADTVESFGADVSRDCKDEEEKEKGV